MRKFLVVYEEFKKDEFGLVKIEFSYGKFMIRLKLQEVSRSFRIEERWGEKMKSYLIGWDI